MTAREGEERVTIQFEIDAILYPGNGWQAVATALADAAPIVIPDDRDPESEGARIEEMRWELVPATTQQRLSQAEECLREIADFQHDEDDAYSYTVGRMRLLARSYFHPNQGESE